ncbi:MAG: FAD-dependent oxidoreductase [Desulfovibrio sp.]|nr:FAD-dependent oxidoreductase [Desulfovibrio sp.]MBI4959455.1 FAD-dependent oxidoreductase [Desulfovibrio sp.]
MQNNYLIIGAGPTGLGAARRLSELGVKDFLVLEANTYPGGLSASFEDSKGFTWDVGGHVVFSHYDYFDRMLDEALDGKYLEHQREAWVRIAKTWVPYPFQNNIRYLPKDMAWECVHGLLPGMRPFGDNGYQPADFKEWIEHVFGLGIAKHFMMPYNFKVWATPPELMSYKWIGERVSVVGLEKVVKNILLALDDVSWGPNNTFKFPLYGGTGEIYRRVAAKFEDHIRYGRGVVGIDPDKKEVTCSTGERFSYQNLLFTGPLDILAQKLLTSVPDQVRKAASELKHSGGYIGGVGVDGAKTDSRCWMYFPESDNPFYRVTNFHHYSPNNTPDPDGMTVRKRAYMTEVSFSEHKDEPASHLDSVVDGLVNVSLMSEKEREAVVSTWEMRLDYSYPIPTLGRDAALKAIQPWLETQAIFSRGRFGGWKYEVSNMDHSVMQGVEWAERMVTGKAETTYAL